MAMTNLQYSQIMGHKRRQQLFIQIYGMIFSCRWYDENQITCKEVEIQKAICMFVSQLRSSFSQFQRYMWRAWRLMLWNAWCQSSKGRALYFQQSFTSWIPQRNAGLQLGDRTMEWAIYGRLLTTPVFRPPYCKQVFYESACCLFPPTFRVSISTSD